ncbi:hypothetical protein KKG36_00935 [Patescibacteria group bacterium]|nr:hypothetical protein [Patescibacteria group bacterium]
MIPFSFFKKILLTLAPVALLYLLKKGEKKDIKKKSSLSDFDKSKIEEGEIVG